MCATIALATLLAIVMSLENNRRDRKMADQDSRLEAKEEESSSGEDEQKDGVADWTDRINPRFRYLC
jgi:hypothetical protein